jgi:hypothetical protein
MPTFSYMLLSMPYLLQLFIGLAASVELLPVAITSYSIFHQLDEAPPWTERA